MQGSAGGKRADVGNMGVVEWRCLEEEVPQWRCLKSSRTVSPAAHAYADELMPCRPAAQKFSFISFQQKVFDDELAFSFCDGLFVGLEHCMVLLIYRFSGAWASPVSSTSPLDRALFKTSTMASPALMLCARITTSTIAWVPMSVVTEVVAAMHEASGVH